MIKFSANLGFLWTDLPLIEAIYKAKKHGFDAVELQWPYDVNPIEVKNVLEEINLPFSINSYSMCLCTERNIDKLITNFKKINKIILSEETFCNSFRDIINYHCKDILFYN